MYVLSWSLKTKLRIKIRLSNTKGILVLNASRWQISYLNLKSPINKSETLTHLFTFGAIDIPIDVTVETCTKTCFQVLVVILHWSTIKKQFTAFTLQGSPQLSQINCIIHSQITTSRSEEVTLWFSAFREQLLLLYSLT